MKESNSKHFEYAKKVVKSWPKWKKKFQWEFIQVVLMLMGFPTKRKINE